MRATLIYGAGDVRVDDVPDPKIQQPTDAVVRVLRACVCGSDLWPYGSRPATEKGDRIGHEFLGVVEDVGTEVSGLKGGDLVVAPFVWADNTCDFCAEGLHTSCRHGGQWRTSARVREPAPVPPAATESPAEGDIPMTTWTSDELSRVENAEELRIASLRRDGSLSGWRTIWVVRLRDDLYVRSVNGPTSDWYRGTRVRREGRIRAGGVEKDVTFADAGQDLNDQVDAAYRDKYRHYAANIIDAITSPEASSTTIRLMPRPAGSSSGFNGR